MAFNHGVRLPAGFNSGQNVDRLISSFALTYSGVKDFDDLPIPFRCVATDLSNGRGYVFHDGVLGDALRATMSIPGVFEPVRIGDRMFVDGTLIDPLPTDISRQMGADVVIAVFLKSYVPDRMPESPFGALFRSLEAVTLTLEEKNMPGADILLTVPLTDLNNLQYEKWEMIVARGYAEAERNAGALLQYSLSGAEWQEYLTQRESRRTSAAVVLQTVTMNGDTQKANAEGLNLLTSQPLDPERVGRATAQLAAKGNYARVRPQLTLGQENTLALNFEAIDKEFGRSKFQPIFILDGTQYNNVRFSAGGRFIMSGKGAGSELRTDVLVGSTYQLASEYQFPVMASQHWFVATHADAQNAPLDFYRSAGPYASYRELQTNAGVDVGYTITRYAELRAGYQVGRIKYDHEVGPPVIASAWNGTQTSTRFRMTFDHTDDAVVPRSGAAAEMFFAYFHHRAGAEESFPSLQLKLRAYKTVGNRGSLYAVGTAGSTFGYTQTGFPIFDLGGAATLAAYGPNEIRTNQYWLAQTGYMYKIMSMPPMSGKNVYLVSGLDFAKPFYVQGVSRWPMDVRVGVLAQTLLGPVSMGASVGDSGHRKFCVQIGRVF
jgi:NTE family protein